MNPTEVDVAIIGAGPAGSLAAALLHKEGFSLVVAEKQTFPRFVIGESLLPSSMGLLEGAGLLDAVKACGFMEKYGAVFRRGNEVCAFDFANQFTPGWKFTYQVTRAEFDQALASTVAARGVPVWFGHGVTSVDFVDNGARLTLETPEKKTREVRARFVLDCSGYGRVLPRLLKLERPTNFPLREALFAHVTGDVRPLGRDEGKIWVCILEGEAWIWIIPFADGRTSVGIVAEPAFFQRHPGTPEEQFRAIVLSDPNTRGRLEKMKCVFTPQRITGYACAVSQLYGEHFALVGNATEFLDPIFSSGVTLALESADRAARVLTRHLRGQPVNWEEDYAAFVRQGIDTFRAYVTAWYDATLPEIFFSAARNPSVMTQICSVLAGYVRDDSNPYVTQPERALPLLARILNSKSQMAETARA